MIPVAWHKTYKHPLPEGHKFPMVKYDLIKQRITIEPFADKIEFISPDIIEDKHILRCHTPAYLDRLNSQNLDKREIRKMGFPQSPLLIEREKRIMEGTRRAAELALTAGRGFNIAGGTHHAFSYRPEGFCILNDLAIAARYLTEQLGKKVLIVDLDVHQGNGTAQIIYNDPHIFTFSMHGEDNYPLEKETSDLDIGLKGGTKGDEYLGKLESAFNEIENREGDFDILLYQCGADVLKSDKFGRLSLSLEDTKQRDIMVYQFAEKHRLPVAATMGGGYSKDIDIIVEAHLNTFRVGYEFLK